jgi:integrase/recombinase XerD
MPPITPADAYLEFTLSKDWLPASRRWYDYRLGRLLGWLAGEGVTDVSQLTPSLLRRFVASLDAPAATAGGRHKAGRLLDTETKHTFVTAVRAFVNFLSAEGLLPEGVARRVPFPRRTVKVLRVPTDAEVVAMLRAARGSRYPRRDTALVLLLLDSGCRAAEIAKLRRRDVTLTPDEAFIFVHGKGRREREVALGKQAALAVQKYLSRERPRLAKLAPPAPDDAVFLLRGGKPLTAAALTELLYRLRDAAGLPKDTPINAHRWRHLSAVKGVQADGVYMVSRRLGHANVRTTEGYLRGVTSAQVRRHTTSIVDAL